MHFGGVGVVHLGDGGVVVHPGVYGGCAPARQSGLTPGGNASSKV